MPHKPSFKTYLHKEFALYDGAMGTLLAKETAARGISEEQSPDSIYLSHPELIEEIHRLYLENGATVIETNTFGSNPFKLREHGLENKTTEINRIAVETGINATQKHSRQSGKPSYVALSVGPSGYLISSNEPSLNKISKKELFEGYCAQIEPAIEAGVDIILIETGQDLLEVKTITEAALHLREKHQSDNLFIQVQVTIDENNFMVLGSDIGAVLASLEPYPIDAMGINCSTGPEEMEPALAYLSKNSPFYLSCLPNAGLPQNREGKAVYELTPSSFAGQFVPIIKKYNIEIAGGCCGTTPAHIKELDSALAHYKSGRNFGSIIPRISSQFTSRQLNELKRPVIIGERLNVQGSKKTRKLLVNERYPELIDLAREQLSHDIFLLDICTANNIVGQEDSLMEKLVYSIQRNVDASLVIDTTEEDIIQQVIPHIIGRGIINSIQLEGGKDKAQRILKIAEKYGFMVIALAIDEQGMAYTAEDKCRVAEKMIRLAEETGFRKDFLIFDPLVFSLATGDRQFQSSAVQTLKTLEQIKKHYPEIHTSLGISNVSFGLMPRARKYLNAVFLKEAAKKGLDFAIYNPRHLNVLKEIPASIKNKALDLLYNRHASSLEAFIKEFESQAAVEEPESAHEVKTTPENGLKNAILKRNRSGIDELIKQNLKTRTPREVIHEILLPVMEEVGEKMSTGEIILPYVLQSAEIFKLILDKLTPYFPQEEEEEAKKKVLLATVYGDIHDIGKNLFRTLLENSGYAVNDLGKQVRSETIIQKAREWNPDIIGLSALLVTTSRYMGECVQKLYKEGLNIPVLIGGAAVNEQFSQRINMIEDKKQYPGGVFYAEDAFQGIKKIENILNTRRSSL